jgi:hypothetical protein
VAILNYDASQMKARKIGEMISAFTQIAAVVAGLATVAAAFTVIPRRSLLKGTAAAGALGHRGGFAHSGCPQLRLTL